MFCKNCGNQLSENAMFCPNCGMQVQSLVEDPVIEGANPTEEFQLIEEIPTVRENPVVPEEVVPARKSSKKVLAIVLPIAISSFVIITAILALMLFGKGGLSISNKGYEAEVESYLDFISDKNENVNDFLSDVYFGGDFGSYYSGSNASKIHEILAKALYEENQENAMYYSYYDDYSSWKEYIQEDTIRYFYKDADDYLGRRWEMNYTITETRELSEAKLDHLITRWDYVIDNYDYYLECYDDEMSNKDRMRLRDFIDTLEDMEITDAYGVEVEIEMDSKHNSYSSVYEFTVAEIDGEWVILSGPNFWEILYNE